VRKAALLGVLARRRIMQDCERSLAIASTDVFDDDRPYLQIFEGLAPGADRIVAIPLTMEVNDLPHAMRFGRSPGQYVELFDEALAQARLDWIYNTYFSRDEQAGLKLWPEPKPFLYEWIVPVGLVAPSPLSRLP
jgi:hypothetical protein